MLFEIIIYILFLLYGVFYEITPIIVVCLLLGMYLVYRGFKTCVHISFPVVFLMQGLIIAAFLNIILYEAISITYFAAPVIVYLFAIEWILEKKDDIALARKRQYFTYFALAIGMFIYALMTYTLNIKSHLIGTYFGITQADISKYQVPLIEFCMFLALAAFIWAAFTFIDHKLISVIIFVAVIFASYLLYKIIGIFLLGNTGGILHNIRYANIQESIRLLFMVPVGGYDLTANGFNSSYNMWLEYGRKYGMVVFFLLEVFKVATIVDAVKLLLIKGDKIKFLLLPAFILFNLFYSFEYLAIDYVYLWLFGLFISGMIRAEIVMNKAYKNKEKAAKQLCQFTKNI